MVSLEILTCTSNSHVLFVVFLFFFLAMKESSAKRQYLMKSTEIGYRFIWSQSGVHPPSSPCFPSQNSVRAEYWHSSPSSPSTGYSALTCTRKKEGKNGRKSVRFGRSPYEAINILGFLFFSFPSERFYRRENFCFQNIEDTILDMMHLIFFPLLLSASFDLILASPTLQINDDIGPDLNVFSPDGSDPLNVGSIDIAFNSDPGVGGGNIAGSNINDFHLDPNDDFNTGTTTISTLGIDGSFTGSEITSDNFNLLENPSTEIPLEIASCSENGGPLRAREDSSFCTSDGQKAPINLPLDVFQNTEAALRRFFQKKTDSSEQPSTQVLPPSTSSDDSKKCPSDYPIRCCTNQVGEYSVATNLQVLYMVSPAWCIPSMLNSS